MKTIVLDDDPTGTQSATGVSVLFDTNVDLLVAALRTADSVYVQTNSRALAESEAVSLVAKIKADGEAAAEQLGDDVRFVLRGDSTLRGHVFAESSVFLAEDAVLLFVPAFPEGGRTTRGGVHYVVVGDEEFPAHESEYAQDPVFGFSTGVLANYVKEKSGRLGTSIGLDQIRAGGLLDVLLQAPPGSVVLPDVVNADDVSKIAQAVNEATTQGRHVVVRCAAPLASELAGVPSRGLLKPPLVDGPVRALLVCGSHTLGASEQLAQVTQLWGPPAVVDTTTALEDSVAAGADAADSARTSFAGKQLIILATERDRSSEHNTLSHGERVMSALTTAVKSLLPEVDIVVAKGGITSAEVSRTGIGADSALVLGQVLPGVSVWRLLDRTGREVLFVVVPGNVGGPDTLTRVLDAVDVRQSVV